MAGRRILDETHDLLALYAHQAGDSAVPPEFHLWACLSLVAATLANRVKIELFRGMPLYPNLYTFLIGPSGTGKNIAINTAMNFARSVERVNVFPASKVTAEALTEHLAKRSRRGESANVYLSTTEMSLSVGRGERADGFIRFMTELFSGSAYTMTESTIGRGDNKLKDYCVNWVAGTTVEWLNDSIRAQDIAGGFFARVVPIVVTRPIGRKTFPAYPPDYDEVVGALQERVNELAYLEGSFELADRAREIFTGWNETRPSSSDPMLSPSYERRHELVLKVAMLFAVMEDSKNLIIRSHHMTNAISEVSKAMKGLPQLIDRASETADTAGLVMISEFLKTMKQVRHSTLVQYALRRGIAPTRLALLTSALVQAQQVHRLTGPAGQIYVWAGRRIMPALPKAPELD